MGTILIGRTLSSATDSVTVVQGVPGTQPWPVADQAQLVPDKYDYFSLNYNGSNQLIGVVYKLGGVGGALVATLTLAYDGSGRLAAIART